MAAVRPSHSIDSAPPFPTMSRSMEFEHMKDAGRAYATLNQKRHSIRYSTSLLEDVASIEHVICVSIDVNECSTILLNVLFLFCYSFASLRNLIKFHHGIPKFLLGSEHD